MLRYQWKNKTKREKRDRQREREREREKERESESNLHVQPVVKHRVSFLPFIRLSIKIAYRREYSSIDESWNRADFTKSLEKTRANPTRYFIIAATMPIEADRSVLDRNSLAPLRL